MIKITCPNCGNSNYDLTNERTDGQGFNHEEDYTCNMCDCEWNCETIKTITKQGKEIDE